jgi:hypothetical protein
MSKSRIKNYPIIIFEFSEGFYTTKDLYVNNTFNYKMEEFNFNANTNLNFNPSATLSFGSSKKLSLMSAPSFPGLNNLNSIYTNSFNGSHSSLPMTTASNRKEMKFSSLNEKFKQFDFWDRQRFVIKSDKVDKINSLNNQLQIVNDNCERYFNKYHKLMNINKMRKQIMVISEKIEVYALSIENLKKIIARKQSDLHISSSIFYLNRENYMEKVKNVDLNFKRIEKYKIMYNAFKNKKLIEVTFYFLSKLCTRLYTIPHFYKQKFDNSNRFVKTQYYEKYSKEICVTLGTIASLINYLSKLFNIPLKYPLFINGSRSFIVVNKKE